MPPNACRRPAFAPAPSSALADCGSACVGSACGGECVPGQTRCSSATAVETCDDQGQWGAATACQNACVGGACTGECVPGATRCSSETQLQTCNEQGQFLARTTCPFACVNGSCGGECVPGSGRCNPANGVPQFCSAAGLWQSQAPCPFVCTGSGTCTGECNAGSRRCDPASGQPQVCSNFSTWQTQAPCARGCNLNTGECNSQLPLGSTGCAQDIDCAGNGSSCQGGRCCEFNCAAAGRVCNANGTCGCPGGTTAVGGSCLLNNGQSCDPQRPGQCASGQCFEWFRDSDGDSHGDRQQTLATCGTVNSPAPTGYVASDDDCCDRADNAEIRAVAAQIFSGQTTFFSTAQNACPDRAPFDYNCDGFETKAPRPLADCSEPVCRTGLSASSVNSPCGGPAGFTACGRPRQVDGTQLPCTSLAVGMDNPIACQ